MRCILCDRCKKIVGDSRKIRVVTYSRPLYTDPCSKTPERADNHATNDVLWTKELCPDCAEGLETFMSQATDPGSDDSSENDGEVTE